jgi:magnesium-dependent phosphatase 1
MNPSRRLTTPNELVDDILQRKHLPKLFVFDLDLTMWECDGTWIDTCSGPPFRLDKESTEPAPFARSRGGGVCTLYAECWTILHALMSMKQNGSDIKLAVASRTEEPEWARNLLRVLNIYDWFDYEEIYPTTKKQHFESLKRRAEIQYNEII